MKVIDLLNKISKGELPNKTRFKVYSSCNDKNDKAFICEYDESYPGTIWCIYDDNCKFNYKIDYMRILNYEVELIEDKEINIQNIDALPIGTIADKRDLIINKLVQAVKQLDNKINK